MQIDPVIFSLLKKAHAFETKKDWAQAVGLYDQIVALDPSFLNAYFRRQLCLRERGRFQDARRDLDSLIQITADNPRHNSFVLEFRADTFQHSAELYAQMEKWDPSLKHYRSGSEILAELPEDPRIAEKIMTNTFRSGKIRFAHIGEDRKSLVDFSQTILLTERWLEEGSPDPYPLLFELRRRKTYMTRGMVHEKLGMIRAAEQDYFSVDPISGSYSVGRMHLYRGRFQRAEEHFRRCLAHAQQSPSSSDTFIVQSAAMHLLGLHQVQRIKEV